MISLYFHLPFCQKKCPYCHFFVLPNRVSDRWLFADALLKEWNLRLPFIKGKKILSLYFGGGTPSLCPDIIESILKKIEISSQMEITIEANPEQVNKKLVSHLKKIGINRISLGIQSLDDNLLKVLGRKHNSQQAVDAIYTTFDAGITNISIDLMNELPHQNLESWEATLNQVTILPITHLSLYNLTFEQNTVFTKKEKTLKSLLPSEDICVKMLEIAVEKLEAAGLKRYEISAFAKKGFKAVHNSGYWTARPFLGFGPSAFSYWKGKRFRNICHLKKYAERVKRNELPVDFEEALPYPDNIHECLAIALRLSKGINPQTFHIPKSARIILDKLEEEGFLHQTHKRISLTKQGQLFYDTVAERIII